MKNKELITEVVIELLGSLITVLTRKRWSNQI